MFLWTWSWVGKKASFWNDFRKEKEHDQNILYEKNFKLKKKVILRKAAARHKSVKASPGHILRL